MSAPRYISVTRIHGPYEDDALIEYVDLNNLGNKEAFYLDELLKALEHADRNEITNNPFRTELTESYGVPPIDNVNVVHAYIIWEDYSD
jgi:hypothetical protein